MSQNWTTLATSHTLSASRTYLNENYESLRSTFSGTAAPGSPTAGQIYFNTTTHQLHCYNGTAWYSMCDVDSAWSGVLPRNCGPSYPLTNDLYCGSKQIKSVANPTSANDVVTLTYAQNTLIDGHSHTGAATDGPKLDPYDALSSAGHTSWALVAASTAGGMQERILGTNETAGNVTVSGSWTDLESITITCYANQPRFILFGCFVRHFYDIMTYTPQIQLLRDSTVIWGPTSRQQLNHDDLIPFAYCYEDTPPSSTSYTYKFQGKYATSTSQSWSERWIMVI